MPFTLDEQLDKLSPEQLEELKQELLKQQQTGEDTRVTQPNADVQPRGGVSRAVGRGILRTAQGFGEGALAGLRGDPLPATEKPKEDLEAFEKKERIKAKIKQEFGGTSGGMQIVQLPGGGFAVIPAGAQGQGAGKTGVPGVGAKTFDSEGKPTELENVKISSGGVSGDVPASAEQKEREAVEGGVKKGVEEAFKQAEGLKRALKKVGSITRQFNEALPSGEIPAPVQRLRGLVAVMGAETGLRSNPKLLALGRTAKLQLRAILRDMGEGARLSDQDISQNIQLIEQAGLTNGEREALIATYMQTAVDSMDFRTLRVLEEDPSVVEMFKDLGIEVGIQDAETQEKTIKGIFDDLLKPNPELGI